MDDYPSSDDSTFGMGDIGDPGISYMGGIGDDDGLMDVFGRMGRGARPYPLPPLPPPSPQGKAQERMSCCRRGPVPFNYDEGLDGLELLIEGPSDNKRLQELLLRKETLFCAQRVLLPPDAELDHHMMVVSTVVDHMTFSVARKANDPTALLCVKRQVTQHLWSLRVVSELAQTEGAALREEAQRLMAKVNALCLMRNDFLMRTYTPLPDKANVATEFPLACDATSGSIRKATAIPSPTGGAKSIITPRFAYMSSMGIHGSGSVHVQTRCDWGTFPPLDIEMSKNVVPVVTPNVVSAWSSTSFDLDSEQVLFEDILTSYDRDGDDDGLLKMLKMPCMEPSPRVLLDFAFVHRDVQLARRAVAWLDALEPSMSDFSFDVHAAQLGTAWNHEREAWLRANNIIRNTPVHFVDTAATTAVRARSEALSRLMEHTKLKVRALPAPAVVDGREPPAAGEQEDPPQPSHAAAKGKGRGRKNKKKKGRRK